MLFGGTGCSRLCCLCALMDWHVRHSLAIRPAHEPFHRDAQRVGNKTNPVAASTTGPIFKIADCRLVFVTSALCKGFPAHFSSFSGLSDSLAY